MTFLQRWLRGAALSACLLGAIGVTWGLRAPLEVRSVAARQHLRGRTTRFFERADQPRAGKVSAAPLAELHAATA
jgi:hypothetical protein